MKKMATADLKPNINSLSVIGIGILLSLAISLGVFLAASVIISYTFVPETIVPYLSFITSILSIFVGALFVTKKISHKGWLNGGLTGLFYVLIVLLLGLLIFGEFPVFTAFLMKVFLGFIFGAVSGIIGMNI